MRGDLSRRDLPTAALPPSITGCRCWNIAEDVAFISTARAYYWAGAFGTHFWVDPKENLACLILTQVAPTGAFREGTHAMTDTVVAILRMVDLLRRMDLVGAANSGGTLVA